jgi:alkylation response protein AidB-like acyl-CoA dehydrogenase
MTETTSVPTETAESVDEFAARARAWLAGNLPRIDVDNPPEADRGEDGPWQRARELQKKLYEGGFAGICFPREYGGLGLPIAYQKVFDNEARGYEMPMILNTPTFTICAATILDTGSEDQKRQHISAALRGDEVLVQLLSEPSGGSDLAGVITRADRVGDKCKDMEHQRVRRRLRLDAGPYQLGRTQARGPDDVHGADQQPRNHVAPHQAGQRVRGVLRGVLRQPRTR